MVRDLKRLRQFLLHMNGALRSNVHAAGADTFRVQPGDRSQHEVRLYTVRSFPLNMCY